MQILFVKCLFSSLFYYSKSITWFFHQQISNLEDFFNVNIFFKCKLNINMSINDHSLVLCRMLLKTLYLLPHLFCNVDFELILLIEFQNKKNIGVLINAFWIHLWFVKYRFVRYRFVRYWSRFLSRPWINTDILVNILLISKTSSRRLEDVFKTNKCLQGISTIKKKVNLWMILIGLTATAAF